MMSYWNPHYVGHALRRYTTFRFVVYFIVNGGKAKASENQNITFENTLASLMLKRLHNTRKHFSVSSVEKVACSLYINWRPPIKNSGQWNQWE